MLSRAGHVFVALVQAFLGQWGVVAVVVAVVYWQVADLQNLLERSMTVLVCTK